MTEPERLREVERKLDRVLLVVNGMNRRLNEHRKEYAELQKSMSELIFGDGNGRRGLVVRIDRLEQASARATRLLWLFCGAAVTATTAAFMG